MKTAMIVIYVLFCGASSGSAFGQDCTDDPFFKIHNEKIETTKKQAAEYKPGLRDYYVQDFNDRQNIYLKAALSASKRQDWLGEWKDEKLVKCINVALDELAVIARKTLPSYRPTGYTVRNAAEERLLREAVDDIADAQVIRLGLGSATWEIDKNEYGIPTARFKYGMIYARYPNLDDGFCRIIYVNIVQDYAGGGTYGESYGQFIKSEFAGCPVGK